MTVLTFNKTDKSEQVKVYLVDCEFQVGMSEEQAGGRLRSYKRFRNLQKFLASRGYETEAADVVIKLAQ